MNPTASILRLIAVVVMVGATARPSAAAPILVAEYLFNSGNAADTSGNATNGTFGGGVTFQAGAGQDGSTAAVFSGGSIFASSGLINTTPGGFNTVAFWMKWPYVNSPTQMPFQWGGPYDLYLHQFVGFGFNTYSGGDVYGVPLGGVQDNWVHITAIFHNGAITGNNLIYVNGVNQSLSQLAGGASAGMATNSFNLSGGLAYSGMLDDVRIYSGALSAGEVQSLYLEETAPPVPEPGTFALFGLGIAGLAWVRRKRAQAGRNEPK